MEGEHRVLVVGAGFIGRVHVEALRCTHRADVAVCETGEEQRRRLRADFPEMETFASLDDALRRPWNAAVIATPAHTHLELGRRLTATGIPLLMEKPLALVTDGLADRIDAVSATGVPVMVGFVFRCHPALAAIRSELNAGRIGLPVQIVGRRGAHLPSRRPEYASTYYARREHGGGVVQDMRVMSSTRGEWLVGPIDRLMADAAHLRLPKVTVEDTVHVVARHGTILANYTVNQYQHVAEFTIDVHGNEGSLRADFVSNRWSSASVPDGEWSAQALPPFDRLQWFTRQAHVFLDVVEKRATPPCSLDQALNTLRAVRATLESIDHSEAWSRTAFL